MLLQTDARGWAKHYLRSATALQKAALKIFSIPPTACGNERQHSVWEMVWSKRRAGLLLGRAAVLCYIYYNGRLLDGIKAVPAPEDWAAMMEYLDNCPEMNFERFYVTEDLDVLELNDTTSAPANNVYTGPAVSWRGGVEDVIELSSGDESEESHSDCGWNSSDEEEGQDQQDLMARLDVQIAGARTRRAARAAALAAAAAAADEDEELDDDESMGSESE